MTENWYWDLNDATRAFTARFQKRSAGKVPSSLQAGTYAAVYNFLAAADEAGTTSDGRRVVAQMKQRPNHDPVFGESVIRQDGRRMTPVYVFSVKAPTPDKKFDIYKLEKAVPEMDAYRPLADGHCPLVTATQ